MIYSLKIIPVQPDAKPKYSLQIETISEGRVSSLAEVDDKLITRLNQYLYDHDIELGDEIFDPVDESLLFEHSHQKEGQDKCPLCNK